MITEEVVARMNDTKKRESAFLKFITENNVFYGHELEINSDVYGLDIVANDCFGEEIEFGELKLGSSVYIDTRVEQIQSQQPFYLLNASQYERYKNLDNDFILVMAHIFEGKNLHFQNTRFAEFTRNYDVQIQLKQEVSILMIKFNDLCNYIKNNLCTKIKLHQKIHHQYMKVTDSGEIYKIDRRQIGTHIDLTSQWAKLTEQQKNKIRPIFGSRTDVFS